jgi:hypothetical protein
MPQFQTIAMLLGAYGAGVVTAGLFLPGPPMQPPQQPVAYYGQQRDRPQAASRQQSPPASQGAGGQLSTPSAPPPIATAPPIAATPPDDPPQPDQRRPVRVIPIERAAGASETTGSSGTGAQRAPALPAREAETRQTANPSCNVALCQSHYRSFDEATCTYRSYDGDRRPCTR